MRVVVTLVFVVQTLFSAPPAAIDAALQQSGRGRGQQPIVLGPDGKPIAPPAPEGFDQSRESVAHGRIDTVEYESKTVGTRRRALVYTPPDFTTSKRYPVLYLLHGIGGEEDRAIGGLSMGGAATVNTAFSRPDLFRYVIVMSAGGVQNLEDAYPKFFGNSTAAAKQMRLIWVGVGDQDFALNGSKLLDEALTKNGVKHTLVINEGFRHEWRLWRLHLRDVAPLLFQREGTALSTDSVEPS